MATKKPTRTQSAAPLTAPDLRDADEAHRILFEDVHGVMSILKNALHAEDHGDMDGPDIDCIASGYAERACKTVASHIDKAQELLERYDVHFKLKGAAEIHYALYDLQNLALLAAHALDVGQPLRGERARYPALTAVEIVARESHEIVDRIDKWIVAQTPKKHAA